MKMRHKRRVFLTREGIVRKMRRRAIDLTLTSIRKAVRKEFPDVWAYLQRRRQEGRVFFDAIKSDYYQVQWLAQNQRSTEP